LDFFDGPGWSVRSVRSVPAKGGGEAEYSRGGGDRTASRSTGMVPMRVITAEGGGDEG
jgi:hypothetical protein